MKFSQKKGIVPVKSKVQIDSMDDDLRNTLWNLISVYYLSDTSSGYISDADNIDLLFKKIWIDYFKKPIDILDTNYFNNRQAIRKYFLNCFWWEVYDFIEFIAHNYPENTMNEEFMNTCNEMLKRELSGYRFVGGVITQLTSEEEILEIEEALKVPISQVQTHLNRALELFADRKNPDYRNSIKEAISAVEALCIRITENRSTTLGKALNRFERDRTVGLHPDLKEGFSKLYSYTSEADGIRHSLMDQANLDIEDAKFMLASCSAFINYLVSKASKGGIRLF